MDPDYHSRGNAAASRSVRPRPMPAQRSVEIHEDMPFQERTWRVQRVGWVVMALIVLAGLAGLFAGGPLASAAAEGPGVRVEYGRFERWHGASTLLVRLAADAVQEGRVALLLDGRYVERVQIEHIVPPPERTLTTSEGPVFIYSVAQGGVPGTIAFSIKPERAGVLRGRIGLPGREAAQFTQIVWP
jgi:hypothetical protein